MTNWNGKKILITGGSAGLGLALAKHLVDCGARVAIVGRNAARLHAAAGATGAVGINADVAAKEDVYKIAGLAVDALGGVDVLVNNASYLGATPLRLLADSDCEDLERALATNVVGPFRLTKALLPALLLGDGRGLVVNISSDAAISAYPQWGVYGASKAALDHLTRIFDAELRAEGLRFVAVDPGDMRTAMHFAAVPGADAGALRDPSDVARELVRFLGDLEECGPVRFAATEWRHG